LGQLASLLATGSAAAPAAKPIPVAVDALASRHDKAAVLHEAHPDMPRIPFPSIALAAAALLAATLPAAAQPAATQQLPAAMPTRDVAVRYKVPNSPPTTDSVAWLVSEGRIRTEGRAITRRVTHLIDTRSGNVTALLDTDRSYQDLGRVAVAMTQDHSFIRPGTRLTREGTDRVAGLACTVWRVEARGSSPEDVRRACITEDGVPLRLVEGTGPEAETLYEATQVTYEAQDPANFRVPEGYRSLTSEAPARRR
jgi:hypothetical protein